MDSPGQSVKAFRRRVGPECLRGADDDATTITRRGQEPLHFLSYRFRRSPLECIDRIKAAHEASPVTVLLLDLREIAVPDRPRLQSTDDIYPDLN